MDKEVQTSFIPKKSSESKITIAKIKRPTTIYSLTAYTIFILALLLTISFFFYERYLISQNNQKKLAIQEEISAFEPELTKTLTDIKTRIDSGKVLLKNHLSVDVFLEALEAVTVETISLSDFSFKTSFSGQDVEITVSGTAPSYMALAYQSKVLKESDFIKNITFSEVNLDDEGDVVFTFTAGLNSEAILYQNKVTGSPPLTDISS